MAVTCGFFNSINHDRIYDARQFSAIFDGIIRDGVYATIGDCFVVKSQSNQTVTVGTGRAWFNGTWTLNDTLLPIELPLADIARPRIDAIVLEVHPIDMVRDNSIVVIEGEPSASPERPDLTPSEGVYRYPLAYVHRPANNSLVTQANITNAVGSDETPFVTGLLEVISLNTLLGKWEAELDEFTAKETSDFSKWSAEQRSEMMKWIEEQRSFIEDSQKEIQQIHTEWMESAQSTFNAWVSNLQTSLDGDVAGSLLIRMDSDEIRRILTAGFPDGIKEISTDGKNITSTADDGRKLVKTFSDDFGEMTAVLKSAEGGTIATQVKTFSPSGELITSVVTYTYGRGLV